MDENTIPVPESGIKHDLDYITTDSGNADRLIEEHGRDFRYCGPMGGWLHWTGVRWKVDNTGIYEAAKDVGRELLREAADAGERHEREQLIKHAKYSLGERGIKAMVNLSATDSRIAVEPGIFDSDPYLLNVANGTVDVRTGVLHDHRREDYITKIAEVTHYPDAISTLWLDRLQQWLPDAEVREYIQKAMGLAMTGAIPEQALYINHGFGANGKSTFFDAILSVMGEYAGTIDADVLMEKHRTGSATPEIMFLMGKRMVVASEAKRGDRLNETMVKRLTGDEYLTGRYLYKELVTFKRQFKLFMHVNHRPEITGTDHAIWRRQRLIPWNTTISDQDKDRSLPEKLKAELPGILAWALEGYQKYQEQGLEPPETIRAATDQYREDMDKVGQFIKDECVPPEDKLIPDDLYVSKDRLYEAYKTWCGKNNVYPEQMRKFGERMIELGYHPKRKARINDKQTPVWRGIALLAD